MSDVAPVIDPPATTEPEEPAKPDLPALGVADVPERWDAILTVEGLRTTDHRAIAVEALLWRELPLLLYFQPENSGHYEAQIGGRIESITRDERNRIVANGSFDLGSESGREAARHAAEQLTRWVSIDLEVLESRYVEVSVDADPMMPLLDVVIIEGEEPCPTDWYDEVLSGRIMGATMVGMPAFPQAVIVPEGDALPDVEPMGTAPMVEPGLLASAVDVPDRPPAWWFSDPHLAEPTTLKVAGDGRVFGHLAQWGVPHVGMPGHVTAPRSPSGYAHFRLGDTEVDDGSMVKTGLLTLGTGHAKTSSLDGGEGPCRYCGRDCSVNYRAAADHYDNTGTAVATVAAGEDEFGIWIAGALLPTATDEQVRIMRACQLSGDWRPVGRQHELVAALVVNVPGFPIIESVAASLSAPNLPVAISDGHTRAGFVNGELVALVAAGMVRDDPLGHAIRTLSSELAALRRVVDPLRGQAADALRQRVHG